MKRIKQFFKELDYRHYICLALVIGALLLTIFFRQTYYIRIFQSIKHVGSSFLYLFGFKEYEFYLESNRIRDIILPRDPNHFLVNFKVFSSLLINWDNVVIYLLDTLFLLLDFLRIIIWLPIIILWGFVINKIILRPIEDSKNEQSKALQRYLKFEKKVLIPIKDYIRSFARFLWYYYKVPIILIVLLLLNVYPIILVLVSWYFTFVKSFKLSSLFNVLLYVATDLITVIYNDLWLVIIIGVIVLLKLRVARAIERLDEMQQINEQRAEDLGIATLITAPPGTGKTTMMSSLSTDVEKIFRNKLFEIIRKYQTLFPNFPWPDLEEYIEAGIRDKLFVNRSQLNEQLTIIWNDYIEDINNKKFFNYNTTMYPLVIHNGTMYVELIEAVIPYAEAYFLYHVNKPLAFGNYSIKFDFQGQGFFPLYDYDYLNRDKKLDYPLQYIHILSFESHRLLKRVDEQNDSTWYQMDGHVEAYTEIDKERGNRDDHIGLEKDAYEANQRNDGFNKSIKLARHEYTIDNYPFIKFLFDCQREYSVNADLREACEDRIRLKEHSETRTTLPFFTIDYLLCQPITNKFHQYYYSFRSIRKDHTLYNYLLIKVISPIARYFMRITNLYSYSELSYRHERGATAAEAGALSNENYFIIHQKSYSKQFATDAYSAFYAKLRKTTDKGFADAVKYEDYKATVEELKSQKSYWIDELDTITDKNQEGKSYYIKGGKKND